jgi:GTP cyclohydrolase I
MSDKMRATFHPGDHLHDLAGDSPELAPYETNRPLQLTADHRDTTLALAGVRALLRLMGEDPDREGLQDTPARVLRAYVELASRPGDPAALLGRVFSDSGYPPDQMITVGPIEFVSLCEHHLLPFTGVAHVAYIPGEDGRVVGLSKIPRVVEHYAHRPQVQERLTAQIADAMEEHLDPLGVGVVLQAKHACMGLRGVRKPDAVMVTSVMHGAFRRNPETREEFLSWVRGSRG